MGNKYGGFPGGGMGNMQNLLKQAQKMQADMQKKSTKNASRYAKETSRCSSKRN